MFVTSLHKLNMLASTSTIMIFSDVKTNINKVTDFFLFWYIHDILKVVNDSDTHAVHKISSLFRHYIRFGCLTDVQVHCRQPLLAQTGS